MRNLIIIILSVFLFSCTKDRLFEEADSSSERLSPEFSPTTTPIHVLSESGAAGIIDQCFYKNNFVKLIAYNPNNTRYDWFRLNPDGTETLVSHDSVYITNSVGEFRLDFEQEIFDLGEIDSSIYIDLHFCETEIEIPETFIPNHDGEYFNTWLPIFRGVSEFYVRITDEDDNTIFESESESNPFDGKFEGTALPSGPYKYYVSGMYRSGYIFEQQGVIELIN